MRCLKNFKGETFTRRRSIAPATRAAANAAPDFKPRRRACQRREGKPIIQFLLALWCSWLTRRPLKAETAGSSPASAITHIKIMSQAKCKSTARKSVFLGLSFGAAAGRLRKLVLFHQLQKHAENVCFRCNEIIETAGELSIEHKQPWEGVSVELYWSLDNIAFSHLRCNVPHRYAGGQARMRKVGPEGTAWCRRCKAFNPVAEFSRNRSRWNGLQVWCNRCISQRAEHKRTRKH